MGRKFVWNCVIQRNDGQTMERQLVAGWSPEKTYPASVAQAAAAEAYGECADKQRMRFIGISATLVE